MSEASADPSGLPRTRLPLVAPVAVLNALFLVPLLAPLPGGRLVLGALLAALALLVLAWSRGWLVGLDRRLRGSERAQRAVLLLSSLVVTCGGLEFLAGGLTRLGVVEPYSAMRTMLPEGVEDWRMAHLTADRHRQPDPELLWRPVNRAPYNSQRFKGPLITPEKPAGAWRIFCYGDSNTDGPPHGGWAELLAELLADRPDGDRFQVINAGVTGYSSHQGRLRFARDAPRFRPDLVLVSFGWNDLAPALGAPDRSFRPPGPKVLAAQRLMLEYDLFLVARRYSPRRQAPPAGVGPRVSLDDYAANLEAFIDTAAMHGGRVVLLTRPHREREPRLIRQADNWRRAVPLYNRVVRRLAGRQGAVLIDVQRRFAEHPELFVDECHFTPAGQHRMADLVAGRLAARGLLGGGIAGPGALAPEPAETVR